MGRFDELRAAYETLISSQLNDDDEASVQELISLLATKVKQLGAKVLKSSLSPEPAADDDEGTASSTPPVPNDSSNEDASGEKAVADAHEAFLAEEEAKVQAGKAGEALDGGDDASCEHEGSHGSAAEQDRVLGG